MKPAIKQWRERIPIFAEFSGDYQVPAFRAVNDFLRPENLPANLKRLWYMIFIGTISCLQRLYYVGDEPQVVLDQYVAGLLVALIHALQVMGFINLGKRLGENIVADVCGQEDKPLKKR
jgi:hypothetical protein